MGAKHTRLWTYYDSDDAETNNENPSTEPEAQMRVDPRSPTCNVPRTPLKEQGNNSSSATANQTKFDPRSPSGVINRTPIQLNKRKPGNLCRTPLSPSHHSENVPECRQTLINDFNRN